MPRLFAKGDEGKGPKYAGSHPGDARGSPGGRLDQAVPQQVVAAPAACASSAVVVTTPIPTSWEKLRETFAFCVNVAH